MDEKNFIIEDGVFKKYDGSEVKVLEIPEGVEELAHESLSYSNINNCRKIIFPTTLKYVGNVAAVLRYSNEQAKKLEELVFLGDVDSIGYRVFESANIKVVEFKGKVGSVEESAFLASKIEKIIFAKSVGNIKHNAFMGCKKLKEICLPGVKSIGKNAFESCKSLKSVSIPKESKISSGAFDGCIGLANDVGQIVINDTLFTIGRNRPEWESIPDGVVNINGYVLQTNDRFTLPMSVRTINKQDDYYSIICDIPKGFFHTDEKFSGKALIDFIEKSWSWDMDKHDWAHIYLFQEGADFNKLCEKNINDNFDTYSSIMVDILGNLGNEKHYIKAAEFILAHIDAISQETLQKAYDFFERNKSKKASEALKPYLGGMKVDENDPFASFRREFNEHLLDKIIRDNKEDMKLFSNVKLAGSDKKAPPFVVKCAIVPYMEQHEDPQHISGYKTDYAP